MPRESGGVHSTDIPLRSMHHVREKAHRQGVESVPGRTGTWRIDVAPAWPPQCPGEGQMLEWEGTEASQGSGADVPVRT